MVPPIVRALMLGANEISSIGTTFPTLYDYGRKRRQLKSRKLFSRRSSPPQNHHSHDSPKYGNPVTVSRISSTLSMVSSRRPRPLSNPYVSLPLLGIAVYILLRHKPTLRIMDSEDERETLKGYGFQFSGALARPWEGIGVTRRYATPYSKPTILIARFIL